MSDWISKEFYSPPPRSENIEVQMSKYVCSTKCAQPQCDVLLFWNSDGSDEADLEFQAENCRCGETEYFKLCCDKHKKTFVCPDCEKGSE